MGPVSAEMQTLLDTPEEELLSRLGQVRNDHPVAAEILRVLEFRRVRQQAASGDALVLATKGLVTATIRLAWATWALAGMTILLVLAAAAQAYLMFTAAE
jgi:hypothetical protein